MGLENWLKKVDAWTNAQFIIRDIEAIERAKRMVKGEAECNCPSCVRETLKDGNYSLEDMGEHNVFLDTKIKNGKLTLIARVRDEGEARRMLGEE